MSKKTATIIVTYNGEKWIGQCLKSLLNSSCGSDIFVIDNKSSDNTVSIIRDFPVYLEISDSNFGFGYANNLILKKTLELGYDYFFLVNQDLYVEKETLQQLIDFSEKNSETGIIAPIQYDGNDKEIDRNFQQYIRLSKNRENYYETSFANAASWLITKKCLQKVGFFSPHFSHYGEDRNFCERAIFHQFKISILKNTKVIHDREQKMSTEKAIKLGKIKLLTIFLNPNLSPSESIFQGLVNVFGISKFIFKNHKTLKVFPEFLKEYFMLLKKRNELEREKILQK